MHSRLPWDLVPKVARSFAISLQLLPGPVREPIALAYLLARVTDTEADGATSEAERLLLLKKPNLLDSLASSPDADLITDVWTTIREGQTFDSTRFPSPLPLTPLELDRYTFLVAGSVGIFWTRLCARRIPGFSRRPPAELEPLAESYGKALQLVNILRDRHKDAALGRIYLSNDSIDAAHAAARNGLADARTYTASLRRGRLRMATTLPALLAAETLDTIKNHPNALHAKIPRRRVYLLLARAIFQ